MSEKNITGIFTSVDPNGKTATATLTAAFHGIIKKSREGMVNGSGEKLDQESFLSEEERTLKGEAFGQGPVSSGKPTLGR